MGANDDTSTASVTADDLVADVLERAPEAASVFVARRMACPGCVMAPFMTLAEAAASYDLDPDDLVRDLAAAAGGQAG